MRVCFLKNKKVVNKDQGESEICYILMKYFYGMIENKGLSNGFTMLEVAENIRLFLKEVTETWRVEL